MKNLITSDWKNLLKDEFEKDYFLNMEKTLKNEYKNNTIFPKWENIFNCLNLTPYNKVKVVILGQDPYHGLGQAHGLAFSVQNDTKLPPSLRNIYKEMSSDLGEKPNQTGDLTYLAKQGVLLLNNTLTVEQSKPNSHKNIGWNIFTDKIVELLNQKDEPLVFLLWGNDAIKKAKFINNNHTYLKSTHPSPFSAYRGFLGCKHFSKTNEILEKNGISKINWLIGEVK